MKLKNTFGCCTTLGLVLFSPMYIAILYAEVGPIDNASDRSFEGESDNLDQSQNDFYDRRPDNAIRIREEYSLKNKDESYSRNSFPVRKVSGRRVVGLIQKDKGNPHPIVKANERVTEEFHNAHNESDHSKQMLKEDFEREKVHTSSAKTSAYYEQVSQKTKLSEKTKDIESDKNNKKRQNTVDENQVERKKNERVQEFLRRAIARDAKRIKSTEQSVRKNRTTEENHLHRSKRWEYYDTNYNWENDGTDYNTPDSTSKKETKFERWAKNWQKHALKFIFIFSFIMMFVCCCCAGCKKFLSRLCFVVCLHCKDWRDVCLNRDPTYRMMRKQADEYGIKLDYEEYKRIKHSYEQSLQKHGYSNVDISGR